MTERSIPTRYRRRIGRKMKKVIYNRDFPDGSNHKSDNIISPPCESQKYYDDYVTNMTQSANEPLEFIIYGKEQSYPDRRLVNRVSDSYILHYVTDGEGTFNGRRVGRGEGFVVFPGVGHTMASDSENPWHFYWLCFRGYDASHRLGEIGIDHGNCFFEFEFFDKLSQVFDDIIYNDHSDADINTYMLGAFYILMSYHRQHYLSHVSPLPGLPMNYARSAARFIDINYAGAVRIDDIARELHISRKYLCSVFRERYGMSTKEYLLKKRVEGATYKLLHTDMSVSRITSCVGYQNYTQFSQLFKLKTGLSPTQYRQMHRT